MPEQFEIEINDLPDTMIEICEVCGIKRGLKLIELLEGENVYLPKFDTIADTGIDNLEIYKTFLTVLTEDEIIDVSKRLGGEFVYFPLTAKLFNKARNRKIQKEFNGYNEKKLAKKYKMSVMGIRQIIGGGQKIREKRDEPNKNQVSIFDL